MAERPRDAGGGTPPQRLVVNARVATGDPRRPWADAVLFEGDRVVAVGASAALRKRAPRATVVDAGGATLTPEGPDRGGAG